MMNSEEDKPDILGSTALRQINRYETTYYLLLKLSDSEDSSTQAQWRH